MRLRGQVTQLSTELGHVDRVTMRPDRQAVGDVLQPRNPEKYHSNLIAAVRELGQRLGRHQLLCPGRQLRRGKLVRYSPKHLADLVLSLLSDIREEKLNDRILAHHRVAGDQREESQERTSPFLEKLRVRCEGSGKIR